MRLRLLISTRTGPQIPLYLMGRRYELEVLRSENHNKNINSTFLKYFIFRSDTLYIFWKYIISFHMTALFSEVLFLFPHTFRVSSNVRQDRYRSSIQPDNLLFWVNRRLTSSRSSSPGEDILDGPGHTSRGGHRWKWLLLSWTCPPQTLLPWTAFP